MRKQDLLKALGNINEKYIIEAETYAGMAEDPDDEEHIVMGVDVMSKKRIRNKAVPSAAIAAAFVLVIGSVAFVGTRNEGNSPNEVISPDGSNFSAAESSGSAASDSQNVMETVLAEPVEVGDGIYLITVTPRIEKVTVSFEYGIAQRSKGAQVQAYGQTLDFSSIPDEYNNDFIPYCVSEDGSTVYFADYFNFYKSDIELNSPELLFNIGRDQEKIPATIDEMIAFDNTDLLFFHGTTINGPCVGTITPETGEADFVSCSYSMKTLLCNNGVMLYDYVQNEIALYWEKGRIYEIPICNPKEGECGAWISANGNYFCTYLWGKAEDDRLVERYSVYDTKSGEFLKSFDWTFNKKVGDILPDGFLFAQIHEETQSVYVKNTEDGEYYQFYFGG